MYNCTMKLYPKKSELINTEPIKYRGGLVCAECNISIRRNSNTQVVKFYAKAPFYVHHQCKDIFLSKLRKY